MKRSSLPKNVSSDDVTKIKGILSSQQTPGRRQAAVICATPGPVGPSFDVGLVRSPSVGTERCYDDDDATA